MKVNLKNILAMAALCMTLFANTLPTWAGLTAQQLEVNIFNFNHSAYGTMIGARYSADSKQSIGCTSYTLTTYSWTVCFATDRLGNYLVCGGSYPQWEDVVQGMTDSSFIEFSVQSNYADCSSIRVTNGSEFLK